MTEVLRVLNERRWTLERWAAQRARRSGCASFLARVGSRELPGPVAKQVFAWMCDEDGTVTELLERHGVRVQGSARRTAAAGASRCSPSIRDRSAQFLAGEDEDARLPGRAR